MSDGGGVEWLGGQPDAVIGGTPRRGIAPAVAPEGPAEHIRNALMLLGSLGYLLRRDLGTQELEMLQAIERRVGLALAQIEAERGSDA